MMRFTKRCKVWIVTIVIFDEDPFVLQADDGYTVLVVLRE